MPFVKVVTNLARNQLPAKFLPNFCHKLADVLEKDPSKINWILETDKQMSIGPDNASSPYVLVEVESLAVFESKDNCRKFMPPIFEFLQAETGCTKDQIIVKFFPLQPFRLGKEGHILE